MPPSKDDKAKQKLKEIVELCKNDCAYFIENFCKVKHPTVGEIPFKLFKYQRDSLNQFSEYRFNLFSKTITLYNNFGYYENSISLPASLDDIYPLNIYYLGKISPYLYEPLYKLYNTEKKITDRNEEIIKRIENKVKKYIGLSLL